MKTYSRTFINELGNSITLRVSVERRHGQEGILIFLAGPDSDTENFVTVQEAIELLEGLNKVVRFRR